MINKTSSKCRWWKPLPGIRVLCPLNSLLAVIFNSVLNICSYCTSPSLHSCCPDDNECESEPCGHGRGLCINLEGSYKCHCRQGYKHMVQHGRLKCIGKLDWSIPMFKCFILWVIRFCIGTNVSVADVNECSKQDICGLGGQCVNLPGSYKCECHSGFRSKSHRHPACEGIKTLIIITLWVLVNRLSSNKYFYVCITVICSNFSNLLPCQWNIGICLGMCLG